MSNIPEGKRGEGKRGIQDIRAEPGAQLDLGRMIPSRGVKSLQRPRQVSSIVRRKDNGVTVATTKDLLTKLEKDVADSVARRFSSVQKQHSGERLYAIALCMDCDVTSFYLAAHSHEAVQREVQQRSQQTGTPVDQLATDYCCVPDFAFTDESGDAANDTHTACWNQLNDDGDDPQEKVFRAIVNGMRRFETNGGLKHMNRDDVILIPWIHDPNEGQGVWVLNAVKELNPPKLFARFKEDYMYG